ncbi:MAG: 30S ribosomal protein S8 [Verrucomicrobiae bacterium]|nr:30S ribosomal protein S8 [Verrucomicrobiae bacterium]
MNVTDPIADMLTRLRNANSARLEVVILPYSKLKSEIAKVLKKEGFVREVTVEKEGARQNLRIEMKYAGSQSAIQGLRRISKPGLRLYSNSREVPKVLGGYGVCILSTSRGVMTGRDAIKQKVGGEVLAYVY